MECPSGHWQSRQVAPFWVCGDGGEAEGRRLSPRVAAGSSSPVLRILLTMVTCLSKLCPGSGLLLAVLLLFLVLPFPATTRMSRLTNDSLSSLAPWGKG